jgi:hypothetical protein
MVSGRAFALVVILFVILTALNLVYFNHRVGVIVARANANPIVLLLHRNMVAAQATEERNALATREIVLAVLTCGVILALVLRKPAAPKEGG